MVATVNRLVPNDTKDTILLDFEVAVRNAFRDGFPNADVDGCRCVVRKVAELDLK